MAGGGKLGAGIKRTRAVTTTRGKAISWVTKTDDAGEPMEFSNVQYVKGTDDAEVDKFASSKAAVEKALAYFSAQELIDRGHKISKSDKPNGIWEHQMQSICVTTGCKYQERIEIGRGFSCTEVQLLCNGECTHQVARSVRGLLPSQKKVVDEWYAASKGAAARVFINRWVREKPVDANGEPVPIPSEAKMKSYISNNNHKINKAAPPDNVTTIEQWGK